MKRIAALVAALVSSVVIYAQNAPVGDDIIKERVNVAGRPIFGYDSDRGYEYGAALSLFDYKKGNYPNPRQQLDLIAALSTGSSQYYMINYETKAIIPDVKIDLTLQYDRDKSFEFFGFNGYETFYDKSLPTQFYRYHQSLPQARLQFSGKIAGDFYWRAGYQFRYFEIKNAKNDELGSVPFSYSLFDWYKFFNLIERDQSEGGMTNSLRAGVMYDTRDILSDPTQGIYADVDLEAAPRIFATHHPYYKYDITFRNYLPVTTRDITFAYRVNVQGFLGDPVWYLMSMDYARGTQYNHAGWGSYSNVRGVLRNRIIGKSTGFFNAELRWRFRHFSIGEQNGVLALNLFIDGGQVIQKYDNGFSINENYAFIPEQLKKGSKETLHLSAGAGLKFIWNRNYIISLEYGLPFNRQDNKLGALYFNTGFLF